MSENRVIGHENRLPWHLPDEWAHFREVTGNRPFIMGRKSFEAPDALHSPYLNIILSSSRPASDDPTVVYAENISEALALLSAENEVFILGGASVFEEMLPLAHKLYLTIVHAQLEGDAFFPVLQQSDWELADSVYHAADDRHAFAFSMNLYVRKSEE